jgi:hypothetical protein
LPTTKNFCNYKFWDREKIKEKVVVLRELQRAIIYTNKPSNQAIEGHVDTTFIVYLVKKGARLT